MFNFVITSKNVKKCVEQIHVIEHTLLHTFGHLTYKYVKYIFAKSSYFLMFNFEITYKSLIFC